MKRQILVMLAVVLLLGFSSVGYGQTTDGGFVRGLGGVTLGTETGGTVGGGVGVSLSPHVDIIGEFGWLQNVLPSELQDDIDTAATLITLLSGVPVTIGAKIPAVYALGGVRGNIPTGSRVTPFVDGGVGVGRISLDIDVEVLGIDISQEVEDELELGDTSSTEFMLAVGGGINVTATSNVGFDFGYRYIRIFTDDPSIDTSQVYGAAVLGF